jgi:hypothetical protein
MQYNFFGAIQIANRKTFFSTLLTCLPLAEGVAKRAHPDGAVRQILHHQLRDRDRLAVDLVTVGNAPRHHHHLVKQEQLKFLWKTKKTRKIISSSLVILE